MSARPAGTTKKRKVRPLYDGGDCASHGRQSGINTIRIAKPFTHPLDVAAGLEATASSHQTKRPRYQKITRAQFSTFEERSMRDVAARKAGKHYLTRVSAWTDLWISPSYVFTASSC
jgi:hypothetical protein